MRAQGCRVMGIRLVPLLVFLTLAGPLIAQGGGDPQTFREQYATMMSNFERIFAARGDVAGEERVQQGLEAMQSLSELQVAALVAKVGVADPLDVVGADD